MAKPYLIFKSRSGIYYVQILLPDGSRTNNKSTGCKVRAEAERTVMEWIVSGNIPKCINSVDDEKKDINTVQLFTTLRTGDFSEEEIKEIIRILKNRNYICSAVLKSSKESIPAEEFLSTFWDYDTSPYVREKLVKGQSIRRHYCENLLSRMCDIFMEGEFWFYKNGKICLNEDKFKKYSLNYLVYEREFWNEMELIQKVFDNLFSLNSKLSEIDLPSDEFIQNFIDICEFLQQNSYQKDISEIIKYYTKKMNNSKIY